MIAEESHITSEDTGRLNFNIPSISSGNSIYMLFVISLLMILSGIMLLYFLYSSGEKVREIRISGLKYLNEGDVLEILSVRKDSPITNEEMESASMRLKEHSAVYDADIKLLAGTLYVNISEKNCAAVIRSGDVLYDMFSDMTAISSSSVGCSGVPVITGSFSHVNGAFVGDTLRETIKSLADMNKNKPELANRISEIQINSRKNSVIFLTDPHLRIEYTGELSASLVNRMYAAVSYYEKENKSNGWIDLSGQDAILVPGK